MFQWLKKTALWIVAVPLLTFVLGVASNQAVIVVNNDTFPVRFSPAKLVIEEQGPTLELADGSRLVGHVLILPDGKVMLDPVHCVMSDQTHLNALADNFDFGGIYSVGDLMIELGEWGMGFMWPVWFFVAVGKMCKKEE